jgi:hypothetical protein
MTSKLLALHTAVDESKDGVTRQLEKKLWGLGRRSGSGHGHGNVTHG